MGRLTQFSASIIGRAALIGAVLLVTLSGSFLAERRTFFLPGTTSDGHQLFEEACNSCHGGFEGVLVEDCQECHQEELTDDFHPITVFDDPRWAADLEKIDALSCMTCHFEHQVAAGGVTVDRTFCFLCHEDVVSKRPTHEGLTAESCATSGCHNYHDNSTLGTAYLTQKAGEPDLLPGWGILERDVPTSRVALPADYPSEIQASPALISAWTESAHARAAVGCIDCHQDGSGTFVLEPENACGSCHEYERTTFGAGKHGIRTALELSPLQPRLARLPMKDDAPERLDCGTCHDAHRVDTRTAAVQACLSCHDDEHSRTYTSSIHAQLSAPGVDGPAGRREVTCATCHLPRTEITENGERRVAVHHNNTFTLRPTDRMVGRVCVECHGLEFALTSIFDPQLVTNNFVGSPPEGLETFRMIEAANR